MGGVWGPRSGDEETTSVGPGAKPGRAHWDGPRVGVRGCRICSFSSSSPPGQCFPLVTILHCLPLLSHLPMSLGNGENCTKENTPKEKLKSPGNESIVFKLSERSL